MSTSSDRPIGQDTGSGDRFLVLSLPGSDVALVERGLSEGWSRLYRVEPCSSVEEAAAAFRDDPPAATVLAFGPDPEPGIDALRVLRRAGRTVPVVVMTMADDPDLGLAVLLEGAQDFVVASVSGHDLARALRYAIERQLVASQALDRESQYRAMVETLAEGVIVRGRDGRISVANHAAEEILGVEPGELLGRELPRGLRLYSENGRPVDASDPPGARVIRTGQPINDLSLVYVQPDGDIRVLSCNIRPIRRPGEDEPIASVATVRDVTDLRRAQAAVEKSEARFKALVQNSADGIVIVDSAGLITYCNPGMERIFGRSVDDYLGRSAFEMMHPAEKEGGLALFADQLTRPGEIVTGEYRGQHADGSWRWLEVAAQNRLEDPAVGGIVANFRDVTDQKLATSQLTSHLDQKVALAELGQLALTGTDLTELMSRAVEATARTLATDAAILLVDPLGEELVLRAYSGRDRRGVGVLHLSIDVTRPTGYTFLKREPLIVADRDQDERFGPQRRTGAEKIASSAYVPLEGPSGPAGVLTAQSREPRTFTSSDVHFLRAVGNVVASALERHAREDDIRHKALHDPLTGLPNRVLFLDRLQQAVARAERRDRQVAVLFLDLDRFKVINDSLGHSAGDTVLETVAERLRGAVRPGDTVARLGGDEFTILCEDVESTADMVALAERIAKAMKGPIGDNRFHVTASIGIALGNRASGADDLVRDADAAMYRAKERGRDRCEVFDEVTRDRAVRRLELEQELRLAVELDELLIHLQPIVDVAHERLVGAEALVRWEHPRLGLIHPSEFVPLAEETGLIVALGAWVLHRACEVAQSWTSDEPLSVSVNVSARQLSDAGLAQTVAQALEESGLAPERLCLEITESAVMEDVQRSVRILRLLKGLGVRLSIDDFGTGYSSLSYLKQFPVDELKVDRSFIDGLGQEAHDSTIVSAVVGLAHNMGVKAVAEGVETPLQLAELVHLGCDHAQGFLWSRPASVASFADWLDGSKGTSDDDDH